VPDWFLTDKAMLADIVSAGRAAYEKNGTDDDYRRRRSKLVRKGTATVMGTKFGLRIPSHPFAPSLRSTGWAKRSHAHATKLPSTTIRKAVAPDTAYPWETMILGGIPNERCRSQTANAREFWVTVAPLFQSKRYVFTSGSLGRRHHDSPRTQPPEVDVEARP